MTLNDFTAALSDALIERGIPERAVRSHVSRLILSLSSDDLSEIASFGSVDDLDEIADATAEMMKKKMGIPVSHPTAPSHRTTPAADENAFSADQSTKAEAENGTSSDNTGDDSAAKDTGSCEIINDENPSAENAAEVPDNADNADPDEKDSAVTVGNQNLPCQDGSESKEEFSAETLIPENAENNPEDKADTEVEFDEDTDADDDLNGSDDWDETKVYEISDIMNISSESRRSGADAESFAPSDESDAITEDEDDLSQYAPSAEMMATFGQHDDSVNLRRRSRRNKDEDDGFDLPKISETAEGRKKFITTTVLLSPFFAIGFALYFALWGVVFAIEVGLIVGFIAALIATAALGALSSVAGIIYGAISLSTQKSVGIYEIGFGILIGGCALLACVLIYNFALRFMPFAIKKTAEFCRTAWRRVRVLLREYRGRFSK